MASPGPADPPPCRECIALSTDLREAQNSNDEIGLLVVRARITRHFKTTHGSKVDA
ncbi:hypothetical protein GCM10010324_23860 [Streptomyces hiroshimensis]|uniref:Uncharacterized protein n=1 Tax=Streptomyces hiroshimensis TaxID=66424 RepID=A0ABQ2Y9Z0_9ACTN|nr:hypothetical protein GCM10010324_23860 [Streptomyces hiroshimensis]